MRASATIKRSFSWSEFMLSMLPRRDPPSLKKPLAAVPLKKFDWVYTEGRGLEPLGTAAAIGSGLWIIKSFFTSFSSIKAFSTFISSSFFDWP